MIKDFKKQLYIGALLHDIGKFWQRADEDLQSTKHDKLSASFLNQFFPDQLINFIAAKHHKSEIKNTDGPAENVALARIVCEADSLTSGEREEDKLQTIQDPIISILTKVDTKDLKPKVKEQPISSFNASEYKFPVGDIDRRMFISDYKNSWSKFVKDFEKADKDNIETLFYLSKKYLWCIPSSSWKTVPDVSLHEHSRLTAAISLCMMNYFDDNKTELKNLNSNIIENRNDERYILLCLDITGIQKFIYNIAHSGASKALKGRSFLIQQYLDTISKKLVSEKYLNLSVANILYCSGGKAYIIAQKTENSLKIIDSFKKSIEEQLMREYFGELGVVIGYVPLKGSDFLNDKSTKKSKITEKWDEVSKVTEQNKFRKFSGIINESFFDAIEPGGDVIRCSATSVDLCTKNDILKEHSKKELSIGSENNFVEHVTKYGKLYEILEDDKISRVENDFISEEQFKAQVIGFKLRNGMRAIKENAGINGIDILGLDSIEILPKRDEECSDKILINSDDITNTKSKGFKFYGGNWLPARDFNELLDGIDFGFKKLGVLRMDVDNLGLIFKSGLGDGATISRIVQLSMMLDFFFSNYLNLLRDKYWEPIQGVVNEKTEYPLREMMQIVYAGGDDVFITGFWAVLPDVAKWINDEFLKFAGGNKNFTISAGIYIFPNKYPIYKAAETAGEFENQAKNFIRIIEGNEIRKDAISFLGYALSWNDFAVIRSYVKDLHKLIKSKYLSKSFLNKLQNIYSEFERNKGNLWSSWRWNAAYSLSRYSKQYEKHPETKTFIEKLSAQLFISSITEQDFIKLLNLLATWAEYLTRKEK